MKRLVASAATISMSVLDLVVPDWVVVSARWRAAGSWSVAVLRPGRRDHRLAPRIRWGVAEQAARLVDREQCVAVAGTGADRHGRIRLGHQLAVRSVAGRIAGSDDERLRPDDICGQRETARL